MLLNSYCVVNLYGDTALFEMVKREREHRCCFVPEKKVDFFVVNFATRNVILSSATAIALRICAIVRRRLDVLSNKFNNSYHHDKTTVKI